MLGSSGGGVCDAPLPWLTLDTLFTAISSPIAPFRTYCETNLANRLMPSAYCSEDRKSPKSLHWQLPTLLPAFRAPGIPGNFGRLQIFHWNLVVHHDVKVIIFEFILNELWRHHRHCTLHKFAATLWHFVWRPQSIWQFGVSCEYGLQNTGDFCPSIHPSPVRPMCDYVSIYYSVHVAIRTQIPHKQWTLLKF